MKQIYNLIYDKLRIKLLICLTIFYGISSTANSSSSGNTIDEQLLRVSWGNMTLGDMRSPVLWLDFAYNSVFSFSWLVICKKLALLLCSASLKTAWPTWCLLFRFQVNLTLRRPGTKIDHQGIKIEFIGQIGENFLRHSPIYVLIFNLNALIINWLPCYTTLL